MENKRKTGLDIAMMIVRIVYILGYLGMTIFSMTLGIRDLVLSKQDPNGGHNALGFVLITITVGSIVYGVVTLLGITNLVLSIINKNAPRRKLNIITSVIGVLLPYLTEYLMIAIIGPLF